MAAEAAPKSEAQESSEEHIEDLTDLAELEEEDSVDSDIEAAFDRILLPSDMDGDDFEIVEATVEHPTKEEEIPLLEDLEVEEIHEGPKSLDEMLEMQKQELVAGEIDDFQEGADVAFVLSRAESKNKREKGYNQDAVIAKDGIIGALDGLGGSKEGGLAAAKVADRFPDLLSEQEVTFRFAKDMDAFKDDFVESQLFLLHKDAAEGERSRISEAWDAAPDEVKRKMMEFREAIKGADKVAKETGGQTTIDVSTTVTVDGKRYEVFGHAGDGGLTLKRADGTVEELTREDSLLDFLIASGMMPPDAHERLDEEADVPKSLQAKLRKAARISEDTPLKYYHVRMAMMNGLGGEGVIPRIGYVEVHDGDELYLNSDGPREELTNAQGVYDPNRLSAMTDPEATPLENARAINAAAKAEGSKNDDKITVGKRFKPISNPAEKAA